MEHQPTGSRGCGAPPGAAGHAARAARAPACLPACPGASTLATGQTDTNHPQPMIHLRGVYDTTTYLPAAGWCTGMCVRYGATRAPPLPQPSLVHARSAMPAKLLLYPIRPDRSPRLGVSGVHAAGQGGPIYPPARAQVRARATHLMRAHMICSAACKQPARCACACGGGQVARLAPRGARTAPVLPVPMSSTPHHRQHHPAITASGS